MKKILILFFIYGNLIIFLICFKRGINVTPDSIQYVGAAKYLSEFKGFKNPITYWNIEEESMPMTHWPPFYPLAISIFIIFKIKPFEAAKILNMLIFGLFCSFCFFLIFKLTKNFILSFLSGIFFSICYYIIEIFTFAWSEPIFTFLLLINIFLLNEYLKEEEEIYKYAIIPFSMLLTLTRYIGIAFLFSTFFMLFLKNRRFSFFYLIISIIPISLFLLYTHFITWGIADRKFSYIPGFYQKIKEFPENFSLLFFTSLIPNKIRILITSIIFFISIFLFLLKRDKFSQILISHSISYLFFLTIAMLLFDPGILFDTRFLFPLFILLAIFLIYEFKKIKFLFYPLIVSLIFLSFCKDLKEFPLYAINGHPFSYSKKDAYLEICDFLKNKEIKGLIYSNYPDAIYYFTMKPAKIFPSKYFPNSLREFKEMCKKKKINIVYIKRYPVKSYLYSLQEILSLSNFKKVYETLDGVIYEEF